MSIFSDVGEEFHNATPGGKALMLVAILVIAGLGFYVWKQQQGNAASAGTLVPLDLTGGSSTGSGSSSSSTPSSSTSGNSHRFPEPKNTHKPPPVQGGTQKTFTLTPEWLAAHKHGPLHQLAKELGISYMDLFNANRNILGNDPKHATYKVNQVLVIPSASTTNTSQTPSGNNGLVQTLPNSMIKQNTQLKAH